MKCIEKGEICPEHNRQCKQCKLDECKEVIHMIEEEQKYTDKDNLEKLIKQLPEECKNCSMLEIINIAKKEVYCAYRIKERCLLLEKRNSIEENNFIS